MESVELLGVVMGVTAMIKQFIPEAHRALFCPLAAVLVGMGIFTYQWLELAYPLVEGLALGLTAAGLYKEGKNVVPSKK